MIAVVVPCYNEKTRLNHVPFIEFLEKNLEYYFYFVDDGSTDGTYSELIHNFDGIDRCSVLQTKINLGKGEAIRFAIQQITPNTIDYISFIDGDLEIPLDQLNKLHQRLKDFPDAVAAISVRSSRNVQPLRIVRNIGSKGVKFISSYILRLKIPIVDTQCGCKMFSTLVINIFESPFISSWLFDIEHILRIRDCYDPTGKFIEQVELKSLNVVEEKKNYDVRGIKRLVTELRKINAFYNS